MNVLIFFSMSIDGGMIEGKIFYFYNQINFNLMNVRWYCSNVCNVYVEDWLYMYCISINCTICLVNNKLKYIIIRNATYYLACDYV